MAFTKATKAHIVDAFPRFSKVTESLVSAVRREGGARDAMADVRDKVTATVETVSGIVLDILRIEGTTLEEQHAYLMLVRGEVFPNASDPRTYNVLTTYLSLLRSYSSAERFGVSWEETRPNPEDRNERVYTATDGRRGALDRWTNAVATAKALNELAPPKAKGKGKGKADPDDTAGRADLPEVPEETWPTGWVKTLAIADKAIAKHCKEIGAPEVARDEIQHVLRQLTLHQVKTNG